MSSFSVEQLESRTLFAGVTLLATGRLGGTNGWIQTMTDDITARLGGPTQVPQYVLSVSLDTTTGNLVPGIQHVAGTATPQTSSSGEIIIQIDYYSISANASYSSVAIGQTIGNFLMSTPVDGVLLSQLPIHEIGVSRGTGILDQVANTLGQAGIWVSQQTNLDPNPLAPQGDPVSTLYDNVEFVDNYWRNDGSVSQINDGHAVTGAYNLNVSWLDANSVGYATPHLAPVGYYIGTINQTATYSGEGPIYSNWYGTTPLMPARNATGFIYTDLVGAARPLSGVWAASGGTGVRTATVQQGVQWGNVSDLAITSGNSVASGDAITASYIYQDRGSAATINYYLDTDRNPYNNFAASLGSNSVAASSTTLNGTTSVSTNGVAPGTYYLCAKITDAAGNTRYDYSPVTAPLTVTARTGPDPRLTASNVTALGVTSYQFSVSYTDTANVVAATLGDSNLTVTGPNGYRANATLVSTGLSNANTLSAVYSIPVPGGAWTFNNNGVYTVTLAGGQVADVFGATAPARQLGTFLVTVPGLGNLKVSVLNVPSATGVASAGDSPLAGQLVFLDISGSGTVVGNPVAYTDASGSAMFSNVLVGTYRVGVLAKQGYEVAGAETQATVVQAQTVNAPALGEFALPATLTGRAFDDFNANGIWDAGEPGLAGINVYVDLNNTGVYQPGDPTATTDASGSYSFAGLAIDTPLTVRESVPAGRRETVAASGPVSLTPGQTSTVSALGSTQSALISGSVVLSSGVPTSPGAAGGFEIILTQRIKHGKTTKLITFTNPDGSFEFNGLPISTTDQIQIVKRKGFKLSRHAHSSYTVPVTFAAQVTPGLIFSQTPLA